MEDSSKLRILIVDDDAEMLATIGDILRGAGFEVDAVTTGALMRDALSRHSYALLMMDLRLRAEDGMTLARELRQASSIPIIMISGASDETDRILLLELAADDFLIKPFSPRDMLARVRAVLRRALAVSPTTAPAPLAALPNVSAAAREVLRFGDWALDLKDRTLSRSDGTPCALTPAEFRLLEAFVRHPSRVWSRDQLLEHTRSLETEVFDRTIDVLILRLRRKIEPNPRHPQYIRTERGMGYLFAAPVTQG